MTGRTIRNQQMLDWMLPAREHGEVLGVVAFHAALERSAGTADMVRRANAAGVPVKVVTGL